MGQSADVGIRDAIEDPVVQPALDLLGFDAHEQRSAAVDVESGPVVDDQIGRKPQAQRVEPHNADDMLDQLSVSGQLGAENKRQEPLSGLLVEAR